MNTQQMQANISPGLFWALFSPFGRMGQKAYWLVIAFVMVFNLKIFFELLFASLDALHFFDPENFTGPLSPDEQFALIINLGNDMTASMWPVTLFIKWVTLAAVIKRLQDAGHSGFWALLQFIPLIAIAMWIALGFMPGQPNSNKHGPMKNSYWTKS